MSGGSLFDIGSFISRAKSEEFWPDLRSIVDENSTQSAIVEAVIEKSVNSPDWAQKFYRTPLPNVKDGSLNFASGVPDIAYTLRAGLLNAQTLDAFWRKHREPKDSYKVLDFGCGSGRILRFPAEFGDRIVVRGCEVNEYAVNWIRENFPCAVDRIERPFDLGFVTEPVDLIYAWSIFTHFSEREHLLWLESLAGKLAPGGIMLLTFKPLTMVDRIETDPAYRKLARAEKLSVAELKEKAANGYLFYECYDAERSVQHGVDPVTFGNTFIDVGYIRRYWRRFGDVVEIGTAVEGYQDVVVLKKRKVDGIAGWVGDRIAVLRAALGV
ncbi:MAG: class I SAM-dependent methyltransferase [Parvularculaceae bacterium]|nr:class I SAM-dependent methyltransferase [Parvularculaceae bacterium]